MGSGKIVVFKIVKKYGVSELIDRAFSGVSVAGTLELKMGDFGAITGQLICQLGVQICRLV